MSNDRIGTEVMLFYLQSWGQSVEKRIETLNKAAKAAGLDAVFSQGPNGEDSKWTGPDCDRATEFRRRLDRDMWCGEFNQEARNVEDLIAEFKAGGGKSK
jgi:hypothetical protein